MQMNEKESHTHTHTHTMLLLLLVHKKSTLYTPRQFTFFLTDCLSTSLQIHLSHYRLFNNMIAINKKIFWSHVE